LRPGGARGNGRPGNRPQQRPPPRGIISSSVVLEHGPTGHAMPERPFVHLHCHSHYSLLDGANRLPELVAHVKAQGMNACALTDHGNLYGAVEFYRECKAAGINPIIGYEAYVAPGKRTDREARRRGDAGYHLTLLARNAAGFKNLVK